MGGGTHGFQTPFPAEQPISPWNKGEGQGDLGGRICAPLVTLGCSRGLWGQQQGGEQGVTATPQLPAELLESPALCSAVSKGRCSPHPAMNCRPVAPWALSINWFDEELG